MKTKLFLFTAAFIACALVSCEQTPETPENPELPQPMEYTISVIAGSGGSAVALVDGTEVTKAIEGTVITLTATPDQGEWSFVKWVPTGVTLNDPTANPRTFTMPAGNVSFVAEFKQTEYLIHLPEVEGGSAVATVGGEVVVKAIAGDEVALTATESDGFKFVTWIAPDGFTLNNPTEKVVTFTMPSTDVTFTREYRLALTPTYDEGVVINGVRWATRNVDAPGYFTAKVGDVGMFYQWDMKLGWSGNPDEPMVSSDGDTEWPEEYPYYDEDWITISTFWREENDPSPEGWRVPTIDELLLLCDEDNVSWEWETATATMPAGIRFTDKASGESIFMNAGGSRGWRSGLLQNVGDTGFYWSASPWDADDEEDYEAYWLDISQNGPYDDAGDRAYGFMLRPVAK